MGFCVRAANFINDKIKILLDLKKNVQKRKKLRRKKYLSCHGRKKYKGKISKVVTQDDRGCSCHVK